MALLGSSIDPSLFVNDYSGFARAGEIQGQMYAQMGQNIGNIAQAAGGAYGKIKQFKGQQEAFGKSMDYMAKAFPERAEMFTTAKSAVFDPNANMIQQAAAMGEYQNQFDMVSKMQQIQHSQQMQQAASGRAAKSAARAEANEPKVDYFGNPL